ncbi:MAG: di-heme oxidoredictase family protein [Bacteroidota bacterium]
MKNGWGIILGALLLYSSCNDHDPGLEHLVETGEELSGGATTVHDESVNAFGHAAPNLTGNKDLEFVTGNAFFKRNWVTAPSSTENLDGLGPLFNTRSCSSCHALDGRGAPPLAGEEPVSLLFRLSRPGKIEWETIDDENYGGQFNPLAILGVEPEGIVSIDYEIINGQFGDGITYELKKPIYSFENLKYGPFPDDLMISPRIAPHMVGLGLLEAIEEETILGFADPDDLDGDGISGKANYVREVISDEQLIGRFGWKANQPTVRQQVAGAFQGDIGITSNIFPNQPCASGQADCHESISGGEPELTDDILDRVTLYSEVLAVPARRNWDNPDVLSGKMIFSDLGCSSCHIPKITTGSHPEHPELSNQIIRPFTDLLLHDMGEGLADHRPDGFANGNEWKTPPLWGIGLIKTVSGHTNFLHDGRARNLEEAILWHGGEADSIKEAYKKLSAADREAVIKFLESL